MQAALERAAAEHDALLSAAAAAGELRTRLTAASVERDSLLEECGVLRAERRRQEGATAAAEQAAETQQQQAAAARAAAAEQVAAAQAAAAQSTAAEARAAEERQLAACAQLQAEAAELRSARDAAMADAAAARAELERVRWADAPRQPMHRTSYNTLRRRAGSTQERAASPALVRGRLPGESGGNMTWRNTGRISTIRLGFEQR